MWLGGGGGGGGLAKYIPMLCHDSNLQIMAREKKGKKEN
jgi:hypothetical protein